MTENIHSIKSYYESRLPFYLEMLHQMVSINSFTENPEGVNQLGKLTAEYFQTIGFDHSLIQCKNESFGKHLLMNAENAVSDKPTIALISHLDTVFSIYDERNDDFKWREAKDRIYGPGTVDIKGGTIMIFMVLEGIQRFHPGVFEAAKWKILLNAAEERLTPDFGELCLDMLPKNTRAVLVFEGGTENGNNFPLVTARKGRATFRIEVEGRAAHAGNNHEKGANAIVQLARTIQTIASFTDYQKGITFNPGIISGGSVLNRVPQFADAQVEMRAFNMDVFKDGIQNLLALDGESQVSSQDGYNCVVRIQVNEKTMPWEKNEDTDYLYDLWEESAQTMGMVTVPESRGGLSDGNWTWEHFPTLDGLGPTGAYAHCSQRSKDGSKEQEYVVPSSFIPKALLNTAAIIKLLEMA